MKLWILICFSNLTSGKLFWGFLHDQTVYKYYEIDKMINEGINMLAPWCGIRANLNIHTPPPGLLSVWLDSREVGNLPKDQENTMDMQCRGRRKWKFGMRGCLLIEEKAEGNLSIPPVSLTLRKGKRLHSTTCCQPNGAGNVVMLEHSSWEHLTWDMMTISMDSLASSHINVLSTIYKPTAEC